MMHNFSKILVGGTCALGMICAAAVARSEDTNQRSAAASRGVMQDRSSSSASEALYVEKCSMCHREMGMGTVLLGRRMDPAQAQLEDRTNLTAQFVKVVVRRGLGNMPAIPPGEVSVSQLEIIAQYLETGNEQ